MRIITSKNRPRKLRMLGTDGREYTYLLKGKEDLRLDQVAIQYFKVINSFISEEKATTYYVMPLSPVAGLIQWISNCDTYSELITNYRTVHGITDIENKWTSYRTIQHFDKLEPIQLMEAYEEASNQTPDSTLADLLWFKSHDSESWLQRRKTFTSSTALMSVVGYIIGLGDRHPSNILINRTSAQLVHIDLGDCFEILRSRILYPELVPFRLTRFMERALGSGGVKGSFRSIAANVLKTIRKRRESIIAVLSVFVHDPISFGQSAQVISAELAESKDSLLLQFASDDLETADSKEAVDAIMRISNKLNGRDFDRHSKLAPKEQVDRLIESATNLYNLAHLFRGWHPLW